LFPGGDCCQLPEGRDPVLLTGSIYLIGEILSRIESSPKVETQNLQDHI
jgi:folylpolyglutamate synthase/dihydropteroate synthase